MISTTWGTSFPTSRQEESSSFLDGFLSSLVAIKSAHVPEKIEVGVRSQGLTDAEVDEKKRMATALRLSLADEVYLEDSCITHDLRESQALTSTEISMLALIQSSAGHVSEDLCGVLDAVDWDMVAIPKERKQSTLKVTLRFMGKGKPLPDPDPWT